MLNFLFRGLTAERQDGALLFDALTVEARRPSWYVEGEIPDTLDGRFAVLAAVTALALVRFEGEGDAGDQASVSLTERYIEVMESEHRELGLGDPTLGKTVRKLVAVLAKRVDLWRAAVDGEGDWTAATAESLYPDDPNTEAVKFSASALKSLWDRLKATRLDELQQGKIS
jgi:cytochrome b pre-mRNA-processing protein 3